MEYQGRRFSFDPQQAGKEYVTVNEVKEVLIQANQIHRRRSSETGISPLHNEKF